MPIVDAYGERKARKVQRATWGHLAPRPGTIYTGWILFAHSAYDDVSLIDSEFVDANNHQLDDSPWVFEDMNNYIDSLLTEPGGVYEFVGTYTAATKDVYATPGTFSGEIRRVTITHGQHA